MKTKPDFIIIGAMKCATSSLHDQLALQKGIFMSTPKEPNFFSNDDVYQQGLDWYASLFAGTEQHMLCGESSTHYTKLPTYPETLDRMRSYLPDVRLIYVMRHPIDRLVSQYIHHWTEAEVSSDINTAIDKHPELFEYSCYAKQLAPFLNVYGPDRILPVFFESLTSRPQHELERVCQFIGYSGKVQWHFDLQASNISKERLRVSPWRDALVDHPVVSFVRRTFIPKGLREWVKKPWRMEKRPQLSEEKRESLEDIFDQDLKLLSQRLQTDLTCTTFKQASLALDNPRFYSSS